MHLEWRCAKYYTFVISTHDTRTVNGLRETNSHTESVPPSYNHSEVWLLWLYEWLHVWLYEGAHWLPVGICFPRLNLSLARLFAIFRWYFERSCDTVLLFVVINNQLISFFFNWQRSAKAYKGAAFYFKIQSIARKSFILKVFFFNMCKQRNNINRFHTVVGVLDANTCKAKYNFK